MSWRVPGVPTHSSCSAFAQSAFLVGSLLLALPLAALGVFPAPALAHAAHPIASTMGKVASPAVDITLHFHSAIIGQRHPYRMATDAQGNLYVADLTLDRVSMYDVNDNFVRYFGSGTQGTGNGDFIGPEGVAISDGTVFVVDKTNHRIQTFNQGTGTFISEFGDGDLNDPNGMALGTNGQLYVADCGTNTIVRFSTSGSYLGSFGGAGSGNGQFNCPAGVAASPLGSLYVADSGNKRIQEFNLSGAYLTQWGSSSFSYTDGIAVDRSGMVYATDLGARTVYKFDPSGSLVGSYNAPSQASAINGTFELPGDVAVRNIANTPIVVYVSDIGTGVVQRFDQVLDPQLHTYQAQWGSFGVSASQFNVPVADAVDPSGNIYVTDYNNNRVEKFDEFGHFLLAFGSPGSGNGQFSFPTGIAINPDGSTVYVVDLGNDRVEEFDPSGNYLRQFGQSGNGNGQFHLPQGIATDGGSLYVADAGNDRIQVFDTSGTYVRQFGSTGSGNTQFNFPQGIAVDIHRQELFIADRDNARVQVYTTGGAFFTSITSTGSGGFLKPQGVSTDQRGDVYVADSGNNQIVEMDVNTTRAITFGSGGSGNGQFSAPYDVAVSPANGQIYVVDQGNNRVERFGSPWPKHDTVGIYRPSTKTFYLRNENSTGPAQIVVPMPYALPGDLPIVGDWNGDGVDTVGLYRSSTGNFLLQDANVSESAPDYVFTLGIPGDTPIAGDWNGDGSDGAGIFRPSNGILYLKNSLSTGFADNNLVLGVPGDKGIAGDWNGDGQDSPGVYRPSNETFYVTNKVTNGIVYSDATAVLGISGDAPFTGDWVAQGSSGIGVFRPSNGITYEKNAISTGFADNHFIYGIAGDIPVAGQWVAPSVPFSAPAPHVALGSHTSSAPHPAGGWWNGGTSAPAHPAPTRPPAAATPRRTVAR